MYKTCCDGLARCKCFLFKLIIPLMIIDLCLTGYITKELFTIDVNACCTDNLTMKDQCSYENIGNADDISKENGFCIYNDVNCEGELKQCAEEYNVNLDKLCSPKVLNQVSDYNFGIFGIFLIVKGIGLIFLLTLEFKNCCKKKNDSEGGEKTYAKVDSEDGNNVVVVEKSAGCCTKCKKKLCNCCKKMFIYILKIFFILFGMVVSMVVFYLLRKYKNVTFGSCDSLNDGIISQCKTMSKHCIGNGQHSIYNVYFSGLDLDGPFWIQTSSSVLGSILWLTRLAVLRQKWKNSVFSKVTNTLTSVNLDQMSSDIQNGNKLAEVLI